MRLSLSRKVRVTQLVVMPLLLLGAFCWLQSHVLLLLNQSTMCLACQQLHLSSKRASSFEQGHHSKVHGQRLVTSPAGARGAGRGSAESAKQR